MALVVPLIDQQLKFAIAKKRLIEFEYSSVVRVAEPHDYGIQQGVIRLFVYQLRSTPFARGWRLLDVAKIDHLVVLEQTFDGSRRESSQSHHHWAALFARVE